MTTALSTIVTQAQSNFPSDFHSSDLTSTVLTRFANDLQRRLCRAKNLAFMKQEVTLSTTDDTQGYTLPVAGDSDWTRVAGGGGETVLRFKRDISLELINSDGYRVPLKKLHKEILEDYAILSKEAGTGIPKYYDVDQDMIWLYPIPDHALNGGSAWTMNFEFYGYLADLAAGGNNVLTNRHPLLLEYGITAKGYAWAKDFEAAGYWEGKASEIFAEMVEEDKALQLGGQEIGFFPDASCSIGGGSPVRNFVQNTDFYTS